PDGFKPEEAVVFARMLAAEGVAYLSVMGGCYDSMALPEVAARSAQPAYMADLAAAVRGAVPEVPVIAAGRLATPEIAGRVLAEQKADLVGLARVILADGDWARKAQRGEPVVTCDPACRVCEKRVSRGLPAICPRWPRERQRKWRELVRGAK
ncbi:MAG: oxidoreductase, partial [Desulfotomaculales bacterium]